MLVCCPSYPCCPLNTFFCHCRRLRHSYYQHTWQVCGRLGHISNMLACLLVGKARVYGKGPFYHPRFGSKSRKNPAHRYRNRSTKTSACGCADPEIPPSVDVVEMEGGRLPSEVQKAFVAPNFGCLSFRRTFCRYFVFLDPTVLSGLHLNWWRCTWYFFLWFPGGLCRLLPCLSVKGCFNKSASKPLTCPSTGTACIAFQRSAPVVSFARCFPCQYISYSLAEIAWSHSKGNKRQCAKTCAEKIVGRQLLWLLDSCDCPSPFSLYRCLFTRPAFGFVGWNVFFWGVFLNHKRCHAVHS